MKVAQQGRRKTIGGLAVVVGALLLLTASAQASTAGGGAGTGMAITVQNALTSTLVGANARLWNVDIPKKAVCRSPFQPPDGFVPPAWGPPPWANGKALGLQNDPPRANGKALGLQKDPPWAKAKVKR